MSIITRLGNAPGVRRLVKKHDSPGVIRENPDEEDREPLWCANCGREVLFEQPRCRHCGGTAVTADELSRRAGDLPPKSGKGPTDW